MDHALLQHRTPEGYPTVQSLDECVDLTASVLYEIVALLHAPLANHGLLDRTSFSADHIRECMLALTQDTRSERHDTTQEVMMELGHRFSGLAVTYGRLFAQEHIAAKQLRSPYFLNTTFPAEVLLKLENQLQEGVPKTEGDKESPADNGSLIAYRLWQGLSQYWDIPRMLRCGYIQEVVDFCSKSEKDIPEPFNEALSV